MSYIDILEVREYSFLPEVLEILDTNPKFLESLLTITSSIIDSYVGHSFKSYAKVIETDGDGTNCLRLDEPAISLTCITINPDTFPILLDNSNFSIRDNGRNIILKNGIFDDGFCNVVLDGIFGYAEVPKDVLECVVLLCNSYYDLITDSEQLSRIAGPYQSEKIGNYSYTLKNKINQITGEDVRTTGNSLVDEILDKYKRKISVGVI